MKFVLVKTKFFWGNLCIKDENHARRRYTDFLKINKKSRKKPRKTKNYKVEPRRNEKKWEETGRNGKKQKETVRNKN